MIARLLYEMRSLLIILAVFVPIPLLRHTFRFRRTYVAGQIGRTGVMTHSNQDRKEDVR